MQSKLRYGTSESQRAGRHPSNAHDLRTFLKRFALRGRDPAMADENLYGYCENDRVANVDPSGLQQATTLGAPEITAPRTYTVREWGTVVVSLATAGGNLPQAYRGMRGVYLRFERARICPTTLWLDGFST